MTKTQDVEIRIDQDVYRAAMARAHQRGLTLAAVGKAVLYAEADKARPVAELPEGRPPLREYGAARTPLRFKLPLEPYRKASRAIKSSGRTIASAVEDGLREYAATGTMPIPVLPDLPPSAHKVYQGTVKGQMLAMLADHPDGLTDPEIQDRLAPGAKLTSQPPRRRELVRAGLVVEDGGRELSEGSTWAVYKITEQGQDFLADHKESA
jgi:hypothetical protein